MFNGKSITQVKAGQGYLLDLACQINNVSFEKMGRLLIALVLFSNQKPAYLKLYDKQPPLLPDSSQYLLREDINNR